jgi:uncharacterized membrane protein
MKKYLLTGIALLLPTAVTIYIIYWLIDLLTTPLAGTVENIILSYEESRGNFIHHDTIVIIASRLIVLAFLFCLTLFLGVLGQKITTRYKSQIFARIPFVRTIYRVSKEVTKSLFSQTKKTFTQTVLVPFPKEDTHAIGLVTGDVLPAIKEKISALDLAVFIPTAPHPLSGYIIMTPKDKAIPIDVSTEEVFKFLLSCGSVNPPETKP